MKTRSLISLFLICALSSLGQTHTKAYSGPHSLGPYSPDKNMKMVSLLNLLKLEPSKAAKPICVRSTDGNYVWIENMGIESAEERKLVGSVLLSSFPSCMRNPVHETNEVVGSWKTNEGIGLGSAKQDVLKIYGKPSSIDLIKGDVYHSLIIGSFHRNVDAINYKPDIGDELLEYSEKDSLMVAVFGLRKGIVVWISLSDTE